MDVIIFGLGLLSVHGSHSLSTSNYSKRCAVYGVCTMLWQGVRVVYLMVLLVPRIMLMLV